MLFDLDNRFGSMLDPTHKDHQPLYAVPTLLDIRYKHVIEGDLLQSTKDVILAAVYLACEE